MNYTQMECEQAFGTQFVNTHCEHMIIHMNWGLIGHMNCTHELKTHRELSAEYPDPQSVQPQFRVYAVLVGDGLVPLRIERG